MGEALSRAKQGLSSLKKQDIALIYIVLMLLVLCFKPDANIMITLAIAPAMIFLLFFDEYYVLFAIFIFFYDQLIYATGAPLFRIYSYLLLLKFFVSKTKISFNLALLPAIFVFLMYAAFAMTGADVSDAIAMFIKRGQEPPPAILLNLRQIIATMADLAFVFILAYIFYTYRHLLNKMIILYVAVCLVSGLYGFTAGNVFDYSIGYNVTTGAEVSVTRHMASFNDPNYAGLFMNIALFGVLCLDTFKRWCIKIPLLFIIYYYIIASGSITAFICNALAWAVFIILKYKAKSLPILAVAAIIGGLMLFTIANVDTLRNLNVIKNVEMRIQDQFKEFNTADDAELTSGRTKNWRFYIDYFKKQDSFKKLFGGNIVMTSSLDPYFVRTNESGPHQAYISFLLCFGIVGASIVMLCFTAKNVIHAYHFFKGNDQYSFALLMFNFIWAFYALTLDYFADWKFMFFYFL